MTKEERREYDREYHRKYYAEHREKILQQTRERYAKDPGKNLEYQRKYRAKHLDKIRERNREYMRKYRRENPRYALIEAEQKAAWWAARVEELKGEIGK